MADRQDRMEMSEEEKNLLSFQTEVAGVLRNQKKLMQDVFNQLSSDLRVELEDFRNLLRKNPLFDKQFTDAVRKGTDAVDNFLKEQVKIGTLTSEQNKKLRSSMKEVADQIEDSVDFWNKSSDAIRAGIREKQREADQYKKATETSNRFLATQDKIKRISNDLSKTEKELSDRRKIFNDYTQKLIPHAKEEIKTLEEKIRLQRELGESTDELNQQLAIQKQSLEEQIKTQNEELEKIRELQQARKEAIEDEQDNIEDLAEIRHKDYIKSREQLIEKGKLSEKMSEVMKSHAEDAWLKGGNVMKNIGEGLKDLSQRQTQRGKAMFGESLSGFMKEGRERIAGIQRDKALSGKGIGAKVTGGEKLGAMMKGLPNLMKGVSGALGKILQGVLSKVFSAGIGFLIGKVISIAGAIMKMMAPLEKTMNIFQPFLNFFEIIFGTLGEMLDGVLNDSYAFRKEMTMSAGMATKTATALQMVGDYSILGKDATKDIRASWDAVVEYTNSYVTDIGKTNDEMNNSVVLMAKISKLTGISAQESASFVTQMTNGLEMSTAETNKMVVNLKTDAQAAGLNFKAVMQDVAKEGSRMAMYGEKISTGIMKAAVRARELGGSIKTWTGLMDGFGDGWENVVGFATDFNRLAGAQVIDAFELKAAQVTGDVEKVQSVVVNAMKNVQNESDLRGHLGKRFQKLLGIDDDEYAKLVERVHVEKLMAPVLKNMNGLLSSMKGSSPLEKMFGIGEGDADRKRMLEKTYADWAKGMKDAGKDVNQELQVMQERAMVTAAQNAVKSGEFGSIEEFSKSMQSGDRKATDFFQKAMAEAVNFPDFKNMEDALSESMDPQERIESMIKDIARDLFPGLLKLIAFIAEGLADVVDFVGGDSVAKEMRKVSGMFKISASEAEAVGAGKDISKMYKNEEMKKIFETYLPEGEKMAGIEDNAGLAAQLKMIQGKLQGKEDDSSKAALANVEGMLAKIDKKEKATQDSALFQNQAKTGEIVESPEDMSKFSGKMGKIAKDLDANGGLVAKTGAAQITTYQGLVQIIEGDYIKGMKNLFTGVLGGSIASVMSVFKMLGTVVGGVWDFLKGIFGGFSKIVDGVVSFNVGKIFQGIMDIVVAPFKLLWDIFSGLVKDIFGKAGESVIKTLEEIPGQLWNGLKGILGSVWDFFKWIGEGISSFLDSINPVKWISKGIDAVGDFFGGLFGGSEKQAGDIAFGPGDVTHVMDKKKQVWKLDPQDRVVASTNFDFSRDSISTGTALPKGGLMISGDLSTSGRGGRGSFWAKKDIPEDKQKNINELVAKSMDAFSGAIAEQESGTPLVDIKAISSAGAKVKTAKKPDGFISPFNEFTLLSQGGGQPWSKKSYAGGGTYAEGGCGPTSISMIASTIKKSVIPPDAIGENNKYMRGYSGGKPYGSSATTFPKVFSSLGIPGARTMNGLTPQDAKNIFSSGNVIAGRVPGHFIAIWGISQDGSKILVGDPGNASRIGNVVQPFAQEAGKKGRRVAGTQTVVPVKDIAFSSGEGLQWLLDKGGNVYSLESNEGAMISPKINVDDKLKAKMRNFIAPGGIFEKIVTPPWWQQEASKYKFELGKYVEDIDYKKLIENENGAKIAEFILRSIGYSDQDLAQYKGDLEKQKLSGQLYNELMYGADPNVKKDSRKKKIDWHKLNKESIGKSSASGSGGGASGGGGDVGSVSVSSGQVPAEWNKPLVESIMAVESGGSGFANYDALGGSFPKLRFEPHVFNKRSKNGKMEFTKGKNGFSTKGSETGADAFVRAKAIDEDAAIQSTSYGKYQLMGFHWKKSASSPQEYLKLMMSEAGQDKAFLDYINTHKVLRGIVSKQSFTVEDIRKFVTSYNGSGNVDNYSKKIINQLAKRGVQVADAYFGKGDVVGIMTNSGIYSPRKQDSVAVGTKLPDARTNVMLQEGELTEYLSGYQTQSGGENSGKGKGDEIVAIMRQIAAHMSRSNTPTETKSGKVYLDGANVGRAV